MTLDSSVAYATKDYLETLPNWLVFILFMLVFLGFIIYIFIKHGIPYLKGEKKETTEKNIIMNQSEDVILSDLDTIKSHINTFYSKYDKLIETINTIDRSWENRMNVTSQQSIEDRYVIKQLVEQMTQLNQVMNLLVTKIEVLVSK